MPNTHPTPEEYSAIVKLLEERNVALELALQEEQAKTAALELALETQPAAIATSELPIVTIGKKKYQFSAAKFTIGEQLLVAADVARNAEASKRILEEYPGLLTALDI